MVTEFTESAMKNCTNRFEDRIGPVTAISPSELVGWAQSNDVQQIVTSFVPTGPAADALAGQTICQCLRPYDNAAWPYATHGFFRFKEHIPGLIGQIKGLRLA